MRTLLLILAALSASTTLACPEFRVSFDENVRAEPATGRLVIYLTRKGSRTFNREPADGPFFSDPQPMAGLSVSEMKPGDTIAVHTNSADAQFPAPLHDLPAGTYKAQAVLDIHRDNSSWRREPGNLFSEVAEFEVSDENPDPIIELGLTGVVPELAIRPPPPPPEISFVEFRSEKLSAYWGRDMYLRAAVIFPRSFDPEEIKAYPAVYEIPGFGGDHTMALQRVAMFERLRDKPGYEALQELRDKAYWIVLDPEGPNGHHLFADSVNNGPYGTALVTELMTALQSTYPMLAMPNARVLRGHSSGAWSALWLALEHPMVFSAAWATSPDPVDFTSFQQTDIYNDTNIYTAPDDSPITSYRSTNAEGVDTARMTVRQENRMEQVLGPHNTSAQQWDSWLAVFGPNDQSGNPADLFDPETGEIDHEIAGSFRKFDITQRVRREPNRSVRIFDQRIRLLCGDQDNFYLNQAVEKLHTALDEERRALGMKKEGPGKVDLVPGTNHFSILASPEGLAIPREMVEHFKNHGFF